MADTGYVDIELGFDRTEAILIAEQCKAEGLTVALRMMDDDGNAPAYGLGHAHRISTTEGDAPAVQAIVDTVRAPVLHTTVRDRSGFAFWFGAALLTMILGIILVQTIQLFT